MVACAAGTRLDVRVVPAERKLVELAGDQLALAPADRLKVLLGDSWPSCRDALKAAATVGDLAVLVGPVAAALSGAPQRPLDARVDLLVSPGALERAGDRLLDAGARPDGRESIAGGLERRERWRAGRGMLTVRTVARGVGDVGALCERAHGLRLDWRRGACEVYVGTVGDLLRIADGSPWSEDAIYRTGLRAVLACERYWSREYAESSLRRA